MIARRATPALIAFCVLFSACLMVGGKGTSPALLLIPAAAVLAGAITLLALESTTLRKAGVFMAAAGAGLFLAALLAGRMDVSTRISRPAVAAPAISGFTMRLRKDSILTRTSRTLLYGTAMGATSERLGVTVSSGFPVLVVLEGDYRFSLGQIVEVKADPKPFQGEGPEAYIAYARRADLRSGGFAGPLWELRSRLRDGIHRSISLVGYPASALLEALLTGAREDIPPDLSDGFRKTGSLHILALSGLHAAVIYGAVLLVLSFTSRRWVKYLVGTAVLAFYQFLAGPIPSLARATLMLAVGGAVILWDRDPEPVNILSLAGIAIILMDPYQAWSVSFQLSMLSMLGLLAVAPIIFKALDGIVPRAVLAPLAVAASAQLATLPVVAIAFGEYYPSGLVAGLILIPLTTLMLWLGLAWLLAAPLSGAVLHHAGAMVFGGLYDLTRGCTGFFSRFPGVRITSGAAPVVAACAAAALIGLCLAPPLVPRLGARGASAGLSGSPPSTTRTSG